jgi:dolichol-phosphate mannosyltransferase
MTFDIKMLRPHGFKIPLGILTPDDRQVQKLPLTFGERLAGENKARLRQKVQPIYQIARLRMIRFAAVGVLGTVVNLLVIAVLVQGLVDINYVFAAVIAAEVSILHNFVLQERFVFRDMRDGVNSWRGRLGQHLLFNNVEALIRLPFLILLVETMHVLALLAQALTLAVAFIARFLFVSQVVYRPKQVKRVARRRAPRDGVKEVSA